MAHKGILFPHFTSKWDFAKLFSDFFSNYPGSGSRENLLPIFWSNFSVGWFPCPFLFIQFVLVTYGYWGCSISSFAVSFFHVTLLLIVLASPTVCFAYILPWGCHYRRLQIFALLFEVSAHVSPIYWHISCVWGVVWYVCVCVCEVLKLWGPPPWGCCWSTEGWRELFVW